MAFTLPDLPYAHDALAPLGMSRETLEFHHDLHHKAYVDNGNKLIAGTEWETKSLDDIVKGTYQAGAVAQNGIFNNASQHWNHNLFWEVMGPGEAKKMPGALEAAITRDFGSVAKFKEDFAAAGAGQFGSGWAWWSMRMATCRSPRPKTASTRSVSGKRRCWAATCGNTAITSISATSARPIWPISWTGW